MLNQEETRAQWLERKLAEAPPITPERLEALVTLLPPPKKATR
jgi:hypothetical protein